MTKDQYLSKLWFCHTTFSVPGWFKAGSLWRVTKIWDDSILRASNPVKYKTNPPSIIDVDWRVEAQNIHTGQILTMFTLVLDNHFHGLGSADILVPAMGTGIIEFGGPEELAKWKYDGQGIV